jgi:voltage-gated sodium channel
MSDTGLRGRLTALVESTWFTRFVMTAVIANAIILGVDAHRGLPPDVHAVLERCDTVFVWIFVVELSLKMLAWRGAFFRSSWNLFDLSVVAISLIPAAGPLSVLRVLRVMRALRLVSVVPPLRRVVEALIRAIPGIASILAILGVFFYVGAVLTTTLFGEKHPELFGDLGESTITLFQLMLFDGWAGEVVRPVEETHRGATIFFIAFTVLTGFAVLNLFIAVMVDALRAEHDRLEEGEIDRLEEGQKEAAREIDQMEAAVGRLEAKIDRLTAELENGRRSGNGDTR